MLGHTYIGELAAPMAANHKMVDSFPISCLEVAKLSLLTGIAILIRPIAMPIGIPAFIRTANAIVADDVQYLRKEGHFPICDGDVS